MTFYLGYFVEKDLSQMPLVVCDAATGTVLRPAWVEKADTAPIHGESHYFEGPYSKIIEFGAETLDGKDEIRKHYTDIHKQMQDLGLTSQEITNVSNGFRQFYKEGLTQIPSGPTAAFITAAPAAKSDPAAAPAVPDSYYTTQRFNYKIPVLIENLPGKPKLRS